MKSLLTLLLLLFITFPVQAKTMKDASEELARQLATKLKADTKEDLVVNVYHYLTKKEDSKAGDISAELFMALRNQFPNATLKDARDAGIAGTSYNVLWLDVAYEPKGKMIILNAKVLQGIDKKIITQMKVEYESEAQQTMLMGVFDIDSKELSVDQKTAYSRVFRSALTNQGFKLSSTAETDQKKIESLKEVGCSLDKCALEVGKENKMSHVVSTQYLKLGEKRYQFSATLHDIEKGSSNTQFVNHNGNPDTIESALQELAALLAGKKAGSGSAAFVSAGPLNEGVSGVELMTPQVSGNTSSSTAILVITSIPSEAEVFLGNAKAGKTPYQKTGLQVGQTLRVTLKKPDYHDKTLELPLSGGTNKFTNLKLIPKFGSLQITSDPAGAEVYLADEKVGETPYSNDHALSGTYLLSLKKPLYLPIENQSVEIQDGGTLPLKLKLEPNFGETLVESTPAGASLKVLDGTGNTVLTETSPTTLKLEPGAYRLILEKAGYAPLEFKLNVARKQQQTIRGTTATLRKLEGTVTITATPFEDGTKVLVDGQDMGESPAVLKLSAGSHEITVRSADKEGTQTLTVKDQQSLEVEIKLEEGLKAVGGFVLIKPGSFTMGGDGDTAHRVTISKPFYISDHEVTVGEFKSFVKASGYRTEAEQSDGCYGWNGSRWDKKAEYNWKNVGIPQEDQHPVACVSWNDTQKYLEWLNQKERGKGYRLCTEAEWEYAARAGTTTKWYCGDNESCLDSIAWYTKNTNDSGTRPVRTKQPNAWKLYDMSGNVWEWVQDWYGDYSSSAQTDPKGDSSGSSRVYRGGSFYNLADYARSAYRDGFDPSGRGGAVGFRACAVK
ncbi:SUMF1/EgtB/PvdO family nonheme iron enzyme [Deltaproteobacteria bacterium TL4]